MPRGKKKATAAEAPPSTPPASKRRKTSTDTAKGEVKAASSEHKDQPQPKPRTSSRSTKTYKPLFGYNLTCSGGKKNTSKNLNVWDQERCEEWFDGYCSDDQSVIDPSGYGRLFEDLDVDMNGAMPLILSWKLGATKLFHITRDEWIHGMKALQVDTLDKLKAALPKLEKYASQHCAEETFAEIYHWAFMYMKENEMRKVVDLDIAVVVLKLLFANRENRHVGQFVEFLKDAQAQGHVKSLNKDQWDVFYEFSRTMDDTFTGYSDTAAWPSLFDEYVEWRQKKS